MQHCVALQCRWIVSRWYFTAVSLKPIRAWLADCLSHQKHWTRLCLTLHCTVSYTELNCILHCTVLYLTLYCTVTYTVLHCKLHCTALYLTLYCTVSQTELNCILHCDALYLTLYCTVYYIVFHCILHYKSRAYYSTILLSYYAWVWLLPQLYISPASNRIKDYNHLKCRE